MTLDDVRELKSRWLTMLSQPLAVASPTSVVAAGTTIARAFRSFRERRPAAERALRAVALGVVSGRRRQVRLAIRLHRRTPDVLAVVEQLRIEARNEVDVQYIGRLTKMAKKGGSSAIRPEFYQQRRRPLRIGSSVSDISPSFLTAGTLGCFVRSRGSEAIRILSNNHVLAGENATEINSPIVQPGTLDDGEAEADEIGTLSRIVRLKKSRTNLVDVATAELAADVEFDPRTVGRLGALVGQGDVFELAESSPVFKVGRTTGQTEGRITALEIDNVRVDYDLGELRFDNQIEIEGTGDRPFSDSGDSGSLIVDAELRAVALLFAGGDIGGSNGKGLTYANPIDAVFDRLKIELAH